MPRGHRSDNVQRIFTAIGRIERKRMRHIRPDNQQPRLWAMGALRSATSAYACVNCHRLLGSEERFPILHELDALSLASKQLERSKRRVGHSIDLTGRRASKGAEVEQVRITQM